MIDTHIHAVSPELPGLKPMPEEYARLMAAPPDVLAERLLKEMKLGGIQTAFGMGRLDAPKDDPLGINATLRLGSLVPGLKAVGVADPRKGTPEHLKAIERQIETHRNKIVALKAYLGYLHFGPEHPAYLPYYKLAAKYQLPVIFHTGDNWSTTAKVKFAHPLLVDEVAVDHPNVSFVLAHFGNPWLIDAAEVIYKNNNVWADLSGLFVGDAATFEEMIKQASLPDSMLGPTFANLKRALAYTERLDRFIYGSDWPLAPMAEYRRLIEAIVPKEAHAAVFQTNAEHLFRLKS